MPRKVVAVISAVGVATGYGLDEGGREFESW
jgi:hypothetical protein